MSDIEVCSDSFWDSFWRRVEERADKLFARSFVALCGLARAPKPGSPGELAEFVFRARIAFVARQASSRLLEFELLADCGNVRFWSTPLALEGQPFPLPAGDTATLARVQAELLTAGLGFPADRLLLLVPMGLSQFIRYAERTLADRDEKKAPNRPGLRDGDLMGLPTSALRRLSGRKRALTREQMSRFDASPVVTSILRAEAERGGSRRTMMDFDRKSLARALPHHTGPARYVRATEAFLVEYVWRTTGHPNSRHVANLLAPDRRALDRVLGQLLRADGEDALNRLVQNRCYCERVAQLLDCQPARLAKRWRYFRKTREGSQLLSLIEPK